MLAASTFTIPSSLVLKRKHHVGFVLFMCPPVESYLQLKNNLMSL